MKYYSLITCVISEELLMYFKKKKWVLILPSSLQAVTNLDSSPSFHLSTLVVTSCPPPHTRSPNLHLFPALCSLSSWPPAVRLPRPVWAWAIGWCPSTTRTPRRWTTWRHRTRSERRRTASPSRSTSESSNGSWHSSARRRDLTGPFI